MSCLWLAGRGVRQEQRAERANHGQPKEFVAATARSRLCCGDSHNAGVAAHKLWKSDHAARQLLTPPARQLERVDFLWVK